MHLPVWLVPLVVLLVVLRLAEERLHAKQRERRRAARRARQAQYRAYLRTPGWKSRRSVALQKARGRCRDCGRITDRLDVHHLTYRNVGNEGAKELRALCRDCHRKRHRERMSPLDRLIDRLLN